MINKFSNGVHVKTVVLNDREYYYKILEIGMVQFGVKMNFLWNKQVSRIVFVLKKRISNINSLFLILSGLGLDFQRSQGPLRKIA